MRSRAAVAACTLFVGSFGAVVAWGRQPPDRHAVKAGAVKTAHTRSRAQVSQVLDEGTDAVTPTPNPTQVAPTQSAPTQVAPTQPAPTQPAPTQVAPLTTQSS